MDIGDIGGLIGAIGGLIGAIGGLAGFAALRMQREDRESRKRINHLPPEMRPVLLNVVREAGKVAQRPRDRAWTKEHIKPLEEEFEPLAAIVRTSGREGGGAAALIYSSLVAIQVFTESDAITYTAADSSHLVTQQTAAAKDTVEAAQRLLRTLSGS